jgi:hypothetical protein
MEPLTGWMEYRLVTTMLDPPVFRCRLRPVTELNMIDGLASEAADYRQGQATIDVAIAAVAEWDLAVGGTPIPLTNENKRGWLVPVIAEPVEGRKGFLLGMCIVQDAQNRENFLKN